MSKIKESLMKIQYMSLYGTVEQKKAIQEIMKEYIYDRREMNKQLLIFITKDCMSRNYGTSVLFFSNRNKYTPYNEGNQTKGEIYYEII